MQPRVAGAVQLALPDAKEVEPFDDVGRLVARKSLDGAGEERSRLLAEGRLLRGVTELHAPVI